MPRKTVERQRRRSSVSLKAVVDLAGLAISKPVDESQIVQAGEHHVHSEWLSSKAKQYHSGQTSHSLGERLALFAKSPDSRTPDDVMQIEQMLADFTWLDMLPPEKQLEFCRTCSYKRVPHDHALINEGQPVGNFYVVLSGSVSVAIPGASSENMPFDVGTSAILHSGCGFGDMTLYPDLETYPFSARARDWVEVLVLQRHHFDRFLKKWVRKDLSARAEFLQTLYKDIPINAMQLLVLELTPMKYHQNQVFFLEGANSDKVYFLKTGSVRVLKDLVLTPMCYSLMLKAGQGNTVMKYNMADCGDSIELPAVSVNDAMESKFHLLHPPARQPAETWKVLQSGGRHPLPTPRAARMAPHIPRMRIPSIPPTKRHEAQVAGMSNGMAKRPARTSAHAIGRAYLPYGGEAPHPPRLPALPPGTGAPRRVGGAVRTSVGGRELESADDDSDDERPFQAPSHHATGIQTDRGPASRQFHESAVLIPERPGQALTERRAPNPSMLRSMKLVIATKRVEDLYSPHYDEPSPDAVRDRTAITREVNQLREAARAHLRLWPLPPSLNSLPPAPEENGAAKQDESKVARMWTDPHEEIETTVDLDSPPESPRSGPVPRPPDAPRPLDAPRLMDSPLLKARQYGSVPHHIGNVMMRKSVSEHLAVAESATKPGLKFSASSLGPGATRDRRSLFGGRVRATSERLSQGVGCGRQEPMETAQSPAAVGRTSGHQAVRRSLHLNMGRNSQHNPGRAPMVEVELSRIAGTGKMFGQVGVLARSYRSNTVIANCTTEVYTLDQAGFTRLICVSEIASARTSAAIARYPDAKQVNEQLCKNLEWMLYKRRLVHKEVNKDVLGSREMSQLGNFDEEYPIDLERSSVMRRDSIVAATGPNRQHHLAPVKAPQGKRGSLQPPSNMSPRVHESRHHLPSNRRSMFN